MKNKRFGRLTAIKHAGRNERNSALWLCTCDCGNEKLVAYAELKTGRTKSCGCIRRERAAQMNAKHGMSYSKEFVSWTKAKDRCFNSKHPAFHKYGGSGITMCDKWKNSFEEFYSELGLCPRGHTIDRIDNNKGYEPGNCRWASKKTQSQNSVWPRVVTIAGVSKNISEWAAVYGISNSVIYNRLNKLMWPIEQAVTTPPRKLRKRVLKVPSQE